MSTSLDLKLLNVAVCLSVLEKRELVSIIHEYFTGKPALTTASLIFNKDGELIGVVCNTRNISELVNLRKELEDTKILKRKYSD